MKTKTIIAAVAAALCARAASAGLTHGAIELEADNLEKVPEFQRGWYVQDAATKKFKLDPAKVEVEDVAGLRNTVAATREEVKKANAAREQAVKDALKPFEGIDPVRTKEMLAAFASEEEKKLIASGPEGIKRVVEARMEKQREDMAKQIDEAVKREQGALEVASKFMERVLDNHVRAAAAEAGVIPSAVEDVLLRGRQIFSVNEEGDAVQYDEDGETAILGKDGRTPFSPKEWIDQMKEKAPHWFPATGSGGGAGGSAKGKGGGIDFSKLSPQEKLTAAREGRAK